MGNILYLYLKLPDRIPADISRSSGLHIEFQLTLSNYAYGFM